MQRYENGNDLKVGYRVHFHAYNYLCGEKNKKKYHAQIPRLIARSVSRKTAALFLLVMPTQAYVT